MSDAPSLAHLPPPAPSHTQTFPLHLHIAAAPTPWDGMVLDLNFTSLKSELLSWRGAFPISGLLTYDPRGTEQV